VRLKLLRMPSTVMIASNQLQLLLEWKTDPLTMVLKFSNKWVKGFLNRMHFTKRRVTATMKPETPVHVVQAQMSTIQQAIIEENISTTDILSCHCEL
jgi:hypothetical protein